MSSNLSFKQLGPTGDAATTTELVELLAQALSNEGLGLYFTRRNVEAAGRLWQEWLRLLLAASTQPTSSQLYYLSDLTTAAVMQRWPEDRANWHRSAVLLRLAKIAPFGKWRALREALVALDRQKAAFYESHGPFLYLAAAGTAPDFRGAGLGSVLLDHLCRIADRQQRCMYTEATGDAARAWLKRQGFFELLRHSLRPHAPALYVMVRRPSPPTPTAVMAPAVLPPAPVATVSTRQRQGGSKAEEQAEEQAAESPAQPAPPPKLRPAGSVRSR